MACIVPMLTIASWAGESAPASRFAGEMSPASIVIPKIARPAEVQPDLDRAPWTRAAVVTGWSKLKGEHLATRATWVYVAYDPEALWIGCRLEGGDLETTSFAATQPDGPVWRDDSVEVLLRPPGANVFHIGVNAAGVVYDAKGGSKDWSPDLGVRLSKDKTGWNVVMRIAFADLGVECPRAGDTWSANFCRGSTTGERSSWSDVGREFNVPARFGKVVFGAQGEAAVRYKRVAPITMGPNTVDVTAPAGATFRLIEISPRHLERTQREGPLSALSQALRLRDDGIRRIALTIRDAKGSVLSESWFPFESPAVSARVARMEGQARLIERQLEKLPQSVRQQARAVLDEARPALAALRRDIDEPSRHTGDRWASMHAAASKLEVGINAPAALAATLEHFPEASFGIGYASPMQKIFIKEAAFEGRFGPAVEVALARNEHEGVQVVALPFARELRDLRVEVEPGSFKGKIEVSLVGHVKVVENTPYEVSRRGWWPDPLLSFQQACDASDGEQIAFWVDVATTADTPAGEAEAALLVSARDCKPVRVPLRIRVWSFALPNGTHLPNAFTYSEPQVGPFYRERWTDQMREKYRQLILDHRLNIDHLYRGKPPSVADLKEWEPKALNAFNLLFLGRGRDRERLKKDLTDIVREVKAAGLFDKAYVYGFDEVSAEVFAAVRQTFGDVHALFPGLPTMTTAYDDSFGQATGLREAVDIWVPLTDKYRLEEAERLRAEGKDMWWYICLNPHHPYANWFIEYPAIESRLLTGTMSWRHKVGGFLYYLINNWQNNSKPIAGGPYTAWNPGSCDDRRKNTANGDGSLICPGPDGPLSTIRLENIRDGFEDYEYLWTLADMVRRIEALPATPERAALLQRASGLLGVPDSIVRTVTDYTRTPDELERYRHELAEVILAAMRLAS